MGEVAGGRGGLTRDLPSVPRPVKPVFPARKFVLMKVNLC